MNVGATNSAAQLGEMLKNSQKMQMDFTEKLLKVQVSTALGVDPSVGNTVDTVA